MTRRQTSTALRGSEIRKLQSVQRSEIYLAWLSLEAPVVPSTALCNHRFRPQPSHAEVVCKQCRNPATEQVSYRRIRDPLKWTPNDCMDSEAAGEKVAVERCRAPWCGTTPRMKHLIDGCPSINPSIDPEGDMGVQSE